MNLYRLQDRGESFLISAESKDQAYDIWLNMLDKDWGLSEEELELCKEDNQTIEQINDLETVVGREPELTVRCAKAWAMKEPETVVLSSIY
jgi:hypothetical protein